MKKTIVFILTAALFFYCGIFRAEASEEQSNPLTVERALKFASEHSGEYKSLVEEKRANEASRQSLYNSYIETADPGRALEIHYQIKRLDQKISLQKRKEEIKLLEMKNNILKYFMGIINAENDLELFKESLKISKAETDISKLKSELGLISEISYKTLSDNCKKSVNELKTKEREVGRARADLNKYMGKPETAMYGIVLQYEYAEIGEVNLNFAVARAVSESPSVKEKELECEIAEAKLKDFDLFTGETAESLSIKALQAARALKEAKDGYKEKINKAYTDIIILQERYDVYIMELEDAKRQLAVNETRFELGLITELEIIKARASTAQIEEALRKLVYEHSLKVWAFDFPEI